MTEKEARFKREILISYKALKHSVINFSAGRFYSNGKNSGHHQGIEEKNKQTNKETKK